MNEKFREKIRRILFEYDKCPVCVVYDVLMKELSEVADEAYSQGYADGKRDAGLECGELLSEMADDDKKPKSRKTEARAKAKSVR